MSEKEPMKVPIIEINIPSYPDFAHDELSGELHFTELGIPVPVEFWNSLPDFKIICQPIINLLRKEFADQRIGLRMLCTQEFKEYNQDELIEIICRFGHDKFIRVEGSDQIADQKNVEIFVLQIEVEKALGYNGEDQLALTMEAFHLFSQVPLRVDICVIYDLKSLQQTSLTYVGQEEIGYHFSNTQEKAKAVRAILKINWLKG